MAAKDKKDDDRVKLFSLSAAAAASGPEQNPVVDDVGFPNGIMIKVICKMVSRVQVEEIQRIRKSNIEERWISSSGRSR